MSLPFRNAVLGLGTGAAEKTCGDRALGAWLGVTGQDSPSLPVSSLERAKGPAVPLCTLGRGRAASHPAGEQGAGALYCLSGVHLCSGFTHPHSKSLFPQTLSAFGEPLK